MKKGNGKVRNLTVYWVSVLGISVAVAIVSHMQAKSVENYNKARVHNNVKQAEDRLNEAIKRLENLDIQKLVSPESQNSQATQGGRSR